MRFSTVSQFIDRRPRSAAVVIAGLLFAAAVSTTGCGDSRVIATVDIASFMNESDRRTDYDAPPLPAVLPIPVGPFNVEIPEGLDQIATVEEADLVILAEIDNRTGSGEVDVRVFFAGPGEVLFTQTPAAIFQATVTPGDTTIVEETIPLAEEIEALFSDSEVQFGLEIALDSSGSTGNLTGQVYIQELKVRVVNNPNLGS